MNEKNQPKTGKPAQTPADKKGPAPTPTKPVEGKSKPQHTPKPKI